MSNTRYITIPIDTDPQDLILKAFTYLQAKISGWQPSEGQLDVWMIEAFSNEAAEIATLASQVPKSIFRYYGSNLIGLPSIESSFAVVNTTWFLTDALGHNIEPGIQVGIRDSSGELRIFTVLVGVDVAGGVTETAAGAVLCVASVAGTASSGLGSVGGAVELVDVVAWVDHITQTAASSGGVDAESDDDYLDRLALELQTMSPRPIIPRDFAILARNVAGIQRATVIDGYDPVPPSSNNERMVTIVALDSDGVGISAGIKTDLDTYMEAMREVNFIVNEMDPDVVDVDCNCNVIMQSGYTSTDVITRVTAAINDFLDPKYWGIEKNDNPNDPKTWTNSTTIYYLELATAINNVAGVDRISLLEFGASGGALASTDYSLTGVVTLPNLITLVVATV